MSMRKEKVEAVLFCFIILSLVTAARSYADEFHYNNILVGERPAGLGGAYTAISDDPSGLYYNPAGTVYSMGSNISGSANAYYLTTKHYDNVLGGGWDRKSTALLPNFFGIVQPLAVGRIGFSYAVTDSIIEDQDQTFSNLPSNVDKDITTYVINFNNENNVYNFGPSYAIELSRGISVGATLYFHYRKAEQALNQFITFDNGVGTQGSVFYSDFEWQNVYRERTEWGMRPIVGIMWSPEDAKYSVGLAVSQTYVFDSDTDIQFTCKGYDWDRNSDGTNDEDTCGGDPATDDVLRFDFSSDKERDYPLVTTLGVAFFPTNAFLISGDISYYTGTDEIKDENNGLTLQGERRSLLNASIGAEYYLSEKVAFRLGAFTNLANTPDIERGKTGQDEQVDLLGGSLSLSYFTKGSSITIGTSYGYGKGEAQIIGGSQKIQDMTMSTLMVFVGAGYSY